MECKIRTVDTVWMYIEWTKQKESITVGRNGLKMDLVFLFSSTNWISNIKNQLPLVFSRNSKNIISVFISLHFIFSSFLFFSCVCVCVHVFCLWLLKFCELSKPTKKKKIRTTATIITLKGIRFNNYTIDFKMREIHWFTLHSNEYRRIY